MTLADLAIRHLVPADKPYKRADGAGLYIEVMRSGSKLRRWKYRLHGAEKRLSMGRYPDVSLAAARQARDEVRIRLAAGRDPFDDHKPC